MKLSKEELLDVNGGAIKMSVGLAIGAGITFVIGLVDGILRPLKCRK